MTKGTRAKPSPAKKGPSRKEIIQQMEAVGAKLTMRHEPLSVNQMTYNHYFRDVRHLRGVDIYRIIKLWEITDPALQHALKKVVCAGGRGAKDIDKDIQEAIDALKRFQEMRREDALAE